MLTRLAHQQTLLHGGRLLAKVPFDEKSVFAKMLFDQLSDTPLITSSCLCVVNVLPLGVEQSNRAKL